MTQTEKPAQDPWLLTPGLLTTSRTVKEAMLHDYGSRDQRFIDINRHVRARLVEIIEGQGSHVCRTAAGQRDLRRGGDAQQLCPVIGDGFDSHQWGIRCADAGDLSITVFSRRFCSGRRTNRSIPARWLSALQGIPASHMLPWSTVRPQRASSIRSKRSEKSGVGGRQVIAYRFDECVWCAAGIDERDQLRCFGGFEQ